MSYRRAWLLIDVVNRCFRKPLVAAAKGGSRGGGAMLTEEGFDVLRRYRAMEERALAAVRADLRNLVKRLRRRPARPHR